MRTHIQTHTKEAHTTFQEGAWSVGLLGSSALRKAHSLGSAITRGILFFPLRVRGFLKSLGERSPVQSVKTTPHLTGHNCGPAGCRGKFQKHIVLIPGDAPIQADRFSLRASPRGRASWREHHPLPLPQQVLGGKKEMVGAPCVRGRTTLGEGVFCPLWTPRNFAKVHEFQFRQR